MSRVVAAASQHVTAPPDRVMDFLCDYRECRPRILTDNFSAYRVEQGGKGAGTIFAYHFAAGGRERDYRLHVSESAGGLQEQDQMSSFVSTWTVVASRAGSLVTIESSWDGASGVGGFFERRFAPLGMRRIYGQMLEKLASAITA